MHFPQKERKNFSLQASTLAKSALLSTFPLGVKGISGNRLQSAGIM